MIRAGIFGAGGRMGRLVGDLLEADAAFRLTTLVGRQTPSDVHFADCDVVVDFSIAEATSNLMARLAPGHAALISGVTGRTPAHEAVLADRATVAPVLTAANFSIGVAVLRRLVRQAATALGPGWDVEVFELHHRRKADAPSGTALLLAADAAHARGTPWPDALKAARHGHTGARTDDELGVAALRGGDVVGEHTVFLLGDHERLELVHRAGERRIFALGAVRAARWIAGRGPGRYALEDVLGP